MAAERRLPDLSSGDGNGCSAPSKLKVDRRLSGTHTNVHKPETLYAEIMLIAASQHLLEFTLNSTKRWWGEGGGGVNID